MDHVTDDQVMEGAAGLGQRMRDQLTTIEEDNAATLDTVATLVYERVLAGGLVFAGGAGHSLALVCETFYRAGGLACVYPLYEPEVLPLHGARASTLAERRFGLAEWVVSQAGPRQGDLAVIFSNSGINPYPVELATNFRRHGLPVVAVASRPSMAGAPTRASHRLGELADHVLDTQVPPGDVTHPTRAPRTAALSSLAGVYLWNLLLARLWDHAEAAGQQLPVWVSSNIEGGDQWNDALFERYAGRIPTLLGSDVG